MQESPDHSSEQSIAARSLPARRRQRWLITLFLVGALLVVVREVRRFAREYPARRKEAANARLLEAAAKQDIDAVSRAIASGADLRAADHQNRTALYIALQQRNLPLIDVLLGAGVDVNAILMLPDTTALSFAVFQNDVKLTRHLLEAGADPNERHLRSAQKRLLGTAIQRGEFEMMELLLEYKIDANHLASAIVSRHSLKLQMMESLINHGADANVRSVMDYAIVYNDSAVADVLRRHGADFGLREAIAFNRLEEVRQIIAENPAVVRTTFKPLSLHTLPPEGLSPLAIALERGHREIAWQLLEAGAPLNSVESNGSSLLHAAAEGGDAELINFLLDQGLDVDTADKDGRTPLWVAVQCGRRDALAALLERRADIRKASSDGGLLLSAIRSDAALIKLLIARGLDVNAADALGRTPLFFAVEWRRPESVVALIECGADVNKVDIRGETPLLHAVNVQNLELVQLLVAAGADPELGNSPYGGGDPLQLARDQWPAGYGVLQEGIAKRKEGARK